MATRALAAAAAAGRRAAGQGPLAVVTSSGSSCRRGENKAQSFSHSTDTTAATATAAQVEAALNRKNVDVVLQGEGGRSATLVAADAAQALRGVGDAGAGADDAWVPDQDTGVFVPADEASGSGSGDDARVQLKAAPSVLDQAVFVREEDMEDVERPAVGTVTDAQ